MKIGRFNEYNGYKGTIEYNKYDKLYHGQLIGTNDFICYHAKSIEKLYKEFKQSTKSYGRILTLRQANDIVQSWKGNRK